MTANAELIWNDSAYGRIKGGISAVATSIELYPGDIQLLLPQWASGKNFYLTITDSQNNIEVVKVTDLTAKTNKLTVSRGQDGTNARQWYDGVIINQRITSALLTAIIQKEAHRQVAYNPNGVISADYRGEIVYQDGATACQKRWWKNTSGTKWRLIAGEICEAVGEYYDDDGYIQFPPYDTYELSLLDLDDQGNQYNYAIIYNTNYLFTARENAGIDTYTINPTTGAITYVTTYYDGDYYYDLWTDDTLLYAASSGGLKTFSVSSGVLTLLDANAISCRRVHGDDSFIYTTYTTGQFATHSVDVGGNITDIDTDASGFYARGITSVGDFVAVSSGGAGIIIYSIDISGNISTVDSDHQSSGNAYDSYYDGDYLYVADYSIGTSIYTVSEVGALSYVGNVFHGGAGSNSSISGDGIFVFVTYDGTGLKAFLPDGAGSLDYLDIDTHPGGVKAQNGLILLAALGDGIRILDMVP